MRTDSGTLKAFARQQLAGHWGLAVLVSLVASLLGGSGGSAGGGSANRLYEQMPNSPTPFSMAMGAILAVISIWALVATLIGPAVNLGANVFFLKLCRGQPVSFKDLFSKFSYFWKAFGLQIVMGVFAFLWALLLIIPGIIARYRYAMAMYIMAEYPEIGIMEAISESKAMMYGHKMDLFILDLSFLGWIFLSIFTFGIGFLFVAPYMNAARAGFYLELSNDTLPSSR